MNLKPIQSLYKINDEKAYASMKQKNFIITLCERRGIKAPEMKDMTKVEAQRLIDNMLGDRWL